MVEHGWAHLGQAQLAADLHQPIGQLSGAAGSVAWLAGEGAVDDGPQRGGTSGRSIGGTGSCRTRSSRAATPSPARDWWGAWPTRSV